MVRMAINNLFPCRRGSQTIFTVVMCLNVLFPHLLGGGFAAMLAAAVPPVSVPVTSPVPFHAPAPTPKVQTLHEKVVSSLRVAGHYGAIAGLLDSIPNNNIIKTGMTLFTPNDNAFSNVVMNSTTYLITLLSYHGATVVYNYQALLNLPVNTTIPASASNVVIVVTSNTKGAFKVDDSLIVDPDIYVDGTIAVHGIDSLLNTAKYNRGIAAPETSPAPGVAGPIAYPGPPAPPGSIVNPGAPGGDFTDGPSFSPDSAPKTANPNDASVLPKSNLQMILWLLLVLVIAL